MHVCLYGVYLHLYKYEIWYMVAAYSFRLLKIASNSIIPLENLTSPAFFNLNCHQILMMYILNQQL